MGNRALLNIFKGYMNVLNAFDKREEHFAHDRIKKILIINTTAIGDTLMCTPAIRALDAAFPAACLTALAGESAELVLRGNPRLDEIIRHPGKVTVGYIFKVKGLVARLKRGRFDLAVVLHGNDPDAVPLAYLSGALWRMGMFKTEFSGLLSWYRPSGNANHVIVEKLNALKALSIEDNDTRMELYLSEAEETGAARLLKDKGFSNDEPLVCVHPFGSKPTRSLGFDQAVELIDRFSEDLGFNVVLLGGEKEIELSRRISEKVKCDPLSTAGEINLRLSAAIMKRAKVVVSTDSGPMHIAEALGVPLVALLGSTLSSSTGPLSSSAVVLQDLTACDVARPCKDYKCDHINCMKMISIDEVIDAVRGLCRV